VSLEILEAPCTATPDELHAAAWTEVLAQTAVKPDFQNAIALASPSARATHVRFHIYPDGGVARLRVYGDVLPDWDALGRLAELDLATVLHGGRVVDCSDMFFGSRNNLIMPGHPRSMAEGWETKRRRTPGHDWTIVRLGAPGTIARVEVDTRHFKGNAPAACSLEASTSHRPDDWHELLPRSPLKPDRRHTFDATLKPLTGVTHVRLNIFPDGGVARLRLFGRPA